MLKIRHTEEKLKKVSKNDIVWFFKAILNDQNLMKGGNINLLSAGYSKAAAHQRYAPDGENIKALIVRMNTAKNSKREYFEFLLIRNSKQNVVYHRSISLIETTIQARESKMLQDANSALINQN